MSIRLSYALAVAGLLAAVPIATQAQQNNPAGNLGSNRSVTGAPGTADNPSTSGATTGDATSRRAVMGNYNSSSANPTRPGATGQSKVPGNGSTVAGDMPATGQSQTSTTGTGQGGGAR